MKDIIYPVRAPNWGLAIFSVSVQLFRLVQLPEHVTTEDSRSI